MYLARHAQEERPSGDPNMRQRRPPILTHQDIRFSEAGGQGHEATGAFQPHTQSQVYAQLIKHYTYCRQTVMTLTRLVILHETPQSEFQ